MLAIYYTNGKRILTIDHALDLAGRKLANRVGDGDVGTAAGGLLSSSDLKDTVDIDLEDNFKNGVSVEMSTSKHLET